MKQTANQTNIKCTCGAVQGTITINDLATAKHFICLCDDCQAYAHFLARAPDILDKNGGTDILPVVPAEIKITAGFNKLKCVRLGPKGMIRWYAGCCKSAIANTPASAKMPYAGVFTSAIVQSEGHRLGPVYGRVLGKFGLAPLPPNTAQTMKPKVGIWVAGFMMKAFLGRKNSPSPFFDAQTGQPTVEPYILNKEERNILKDFCGPKPKFN